MKLRFTFAFDFGIRYDRQRRTLYLFPLPGLGLRIELGGGAVQAALPPAAPDDDVLLAAIARYPTATWPELKAGLGGMGATRAALSRDRLLAAGKIMTVVVDAGPAGKRRVLAQKG